MTNKRIVEYEIKIDGYDPIKGSIRTNPNESMTLIREKIEKQLGYRENGIQVEQPHSGYLNQNTKLIVLREVKQKQRLRKQSEESSIVFEEQSIIQKETSTQFMYRQPEMPPRVIGRVKRCYQFFSCMSSNRPYVLPKINKTSKTPNIKQVSSYRKKTLYFLRIKTNSNEQIDFKFINKQICKQWIGYFHKAMDYWDFLTEKKNYSKLDAYNNFMKTLVEKDKGNLVKLEDSTLAPQEDYDKQSKVCNQRNTIVKSNSKIIRLADFKVTYQIGKGAFSTVYKAEREGKIYALKQINKDKLIHQNQLKYAISQLNILKNCNNKCPFIIPISFAFQTEDYLYLAIKYLPFGTLKNIVEKRKQLTLKQAFNIICELIVAIEFLHKNNVLYRDMKPENIMMTQEGHIYLIDFGLSIELDDQQEFAESFVGTPLYLAPERLEGSGKINFKADIFGVGSIFYYMLHGHAPFEADTLASIIFNIKNSQLKIRQDIGDLAQDFLRNTLHTNVSKRLNKMSDHPLFQKVDWNRIKRKQTQIMNLQLKQSSQFCGSTGTGDKDYTEQNYPNKKINDWNYVDLMSQSKSYGKN